MAITTLNFTTENAKSPRLTVSWPLLSWTLDSNDKVMQPHGSSISDDPFKLQELMRYFPARPTRHGMIQSKERKRTAKLWS